MQEKAITTAKSLQAADKEAHEMPLQSSATMDVMSTSHKQIYKSTKQESKLVTGFPPCLWV